MLLLSLLILFSNKIFLYFISLVLNYTLIIKIIDNNDTDLLHNILTIINDIITVHI